MTLDSFQALVQLVGVPTAIAIGLFILGSQGKWVFGRFYDKALLDLATERKEKEHWRELARRLSRHLGLPVEEP